ncbi:cytochrome c5 family protein [uncultured Cocleimonas sp.]|uniref:c-type cytochrome n=1 Tax=uncultured Cocleimonas sp. TaxID=1051587 RepID=UPI002636772E|nr:c-type cytochrome [uncultured Cocleimonas sp.]
MSGSHEKLPKLFWVQIILVVIVGVLYLLAPEATQHVAEATTEVKPVVKKAQQTLAPIGKVEAKVDVSAGSSVARSGESIYKETCGVCHNAGIANAPKIDDKAAWETRMTNGIDGLVKTAIAGKGAMPARGGNPSITDEEIKNVVLYMAKSAGIEVADVAKEETTASSETATNETASATTETIAAPVAAAATTMAKAPEAPAAPASPASPAAPEPSVAVTETPEAPEAAVTKTEAPAAPEPVTPKVTETEAPKAPKPALAQAEPEAPVAKETQDETQKVAPKVPEPMAVAQTEEAPKGDLANGEKVYKSSCFACHASGVAGSPKLGDTVAWAPRLAMGNETLYASAINGKGVMPPKGGNLGLSYEDVKAAVDYMTSSLK